MRQTLFMTAAAVTLFVSTAPARAQDAGPYPDAVAVQPGVVSIANQAPGFAPVLEPEFYAAEMLPNSLSRPYVIMPRFGTLSTGLTSFSYGYRTSPYGEYSRYSYLATGPFPGLPRPFIRTENDHCAKHGRRCP